MRCRIHFRLINLQIAFRLFSPFVFFWVKKNLGRVEWVEEKIRGVKYWKKRKSGEVFGTLKKGDAVIVSELSRLGRSTLQILEIMQQAKEKGIAVHAVKGGWSLNGTMESKIVLTMLAMISEIERDLISERTKGRVEG